MINMVEDITPGAYRDVVTSVNLNSPTVDVSADSTKYNYQMIFCTREVSGTLIPVVRLNGSDFTFNRTSTCSTGNSTTAVFTAYITSDPLGFLPLTVRPSISIVDIYAMDGHTKKVVQMTTFLYNQNGYERIRMAVGYYDTSTVDITSIGVGNLNTGSTDLLFRAFRAPIGAPFNFGDTLSFGEKTSEVVTNIDQIPYQSIGYRWEGNTEHKIDFNNNEATNFYNHQGIYNISTNTSSIPGVNSGEDLMSFPLTHCQGKINDIPNTKKVLSSKGGDHDLNYSFNNTSHSFSGDEANRISVIDFKPDGTLDGHLSLQRNVVFPYMLAPLNLQAEKNFVSHDLSTAHSINVPNSLYAFYVLRFMGYATATETVQITINDDTTNYDDKHLSNNGTSCVTAATAARAYLAQFTIGNNVVGNEIELIISAKAINSRFAGLYEDLTVSNRKFIYGTRFDGDTTIDSFQIKTTNTSSVTGKWQIFGIL